MNEQTTTTTEAKASKLFLGLTLLRADLQRALVRLEGTTTAKDIGLMLQNVQAEIVKIKTDWHCLAGQNVE